MEFSNADLTMLGSFAYIHPFSSSQYAAYRPTWPNFSAALIPSKKRSESVPIIILFSGCYIEDVWWTKFVVDILLRSTFSAPAVAPIVVCVQCGQDFQGSSRIE